MIFKGATKTMKTEKGHRTLSSVSLFIVGLYCLFNSLLMLEVMYAKGTLSAFADTVFFIDLFTWHVYGLFAIISFIIKVSEKNKYSKLNVFLHLIFMLISFFEIYWMIQKAF